MKRLPVLLLAASLAHAGGWGKIRKIAQVTLAATTAGDLASSWGGREVNPLCPGKFGMRQVTVLGGITVAQLVGQVLILRHHQENNKAFAIGDTIGSGLHVWMIVRNAGIQTRK